MQAFLQRRGDNARRNHVQQKNAELDRPMTKKRLAGIFGPVVKALEVMERTKQVEIDDVGVPIFFPFDGDEAYPLAPAMVSLVETFSHIQTPDFSARLAVVAQRLADCQMVTPVEIAAALSNIAAMRKVCATLTPNQFVAYIKQTEVREIIASLHGIAGLSEFEAAQPAGPLSH